MKRLILALLSLACITPLFGKKKEKKQPVAKTQQAPDLGLIFSTIYFDAKGNPLDAFHIPAEEKEAATKQGCSLIYGQPPADGVEAMMKRYNEILAETKPKGERVFMDAGSGSGRVVIGACVVGGFKKCFGVEMSKTRHNIATQALRNLKKDYPNAIPKGSRIKFTNKDARKASFKNVQALWISNLCFPKEVTEVLMKKADAEMPVGGVIMLSADFPYPYKRLQHISNETFKMSWTEASSTHIYIVIGDAHERPKVEVKHPKKPNPITKPIESQDENWSRCRDRSVCSVEKIKG